MAYRKDVGEYLAKCHSSIKSNNWSVWMRARKANSVESAHRILKRALPYDLIPEPWKSRERHAHRPLMATSAFSRNTVDPKYFDMYHTIR